MGEFDGFCAICGGSTVHREGQISIKLRSERFRRRYERRQRMGSEDFQSSPSPEPDLGDERHDRFRIWDEEHSYDPEIIDQSDLEWTDVVHFLGLNPRSSYTDKGFITGPGSIDTYCEATFREGYDPNEPGNEDDNDEDIEFACYNNYWGNQWIVFPFHWCCLELFLQVAFGTTDPNVINKQVLYNLMSDHKITRNALDIDYGDPCPEHDQTWESKAGEEFFAIHPIDVPNLRTLLRSTLSTFTTLEIPQATETTSTTDPFSTLPYDILDQLFRLVPNNQDFSNLCAASPHLRTAFGTDHEFWTQQIRQRLPWFSEAHDLLSDVSFTQEDKDLRRAFAFLDRVSTPRLGLRGRVRMAVANRRRIWGACEQLAALYRSYLPPTEDRGVTPPERPEQWRIDLARSAEERIHAAAVKKHDNDNNHNSSRAVNLRPEGAASAPFAVLSGKLCVSGGTYVTRWVRGWDDVGAAGNAVETCWDASGRLADLALRNGKGERMDWEVLPERLRARLRCERCVLEAGTWVGGFVLHVDDDGDAGRDGRPGGAVVRGVTVLRTDGGESNMGDCSPAYSQRPLLVSRGRVLVGIEYVFEPVDFTEPPKNDAASEEDDVIQSIVVGLSLSESRRPYLPSRIFVERGTQGAV